MKGKTYLRALTQRWMRRYWVRRDEYDTAINTLCLAYGHIIAHHEASVIRIAPGCMCPVCAEDNERVMNEISRVLNNYGVQRNQDKAEDQVYVNAGKAYFACRFTWLPKDHLLSVSVGVELPHTAVTDTLPVALWLTGLRIELLVFSCHLLWYKIAKKVGR